MQVIVNREELVEPLVKSIMTRYYKRQKPRYSRVKEFCKKATKRHSKTGSWDVTIADIEERVSKELKVQVDKLITAYKKQYRPFVRWLAANPSLKNYNTQLLQHYAEYKGFTKSIAKHISPDVTYTVVDNDDYVTPALIRNIINNEASIKNRMQTGNNFWFTDAGYTNFIASKGKPWHRLCHNHIHQDLAHLNFPADRLATLTSFPRPWRTTGNKILVVESSDGHYNMFGTDRNAWHDKIVTELAKHTDRPVEYRVKDMDRKTRDSVYDLLMSSDDYYCVISDSSAAAVEAVWAGVPIITLNTHITTAIARTQISDINNLYRGPIGDWLCALTYSQFTKKEMQNGTAWRIIEKYHV
jgi:hypothetical protein